MKKKIICLFLCIIAIFSLCFLGSCDDKKSSGGGSSNSGTVGGGGGKQDGAVDLPMLPLD